MTYYVVAPDGQKYGPGDIMILNEWARLGRILPSTVVEDAATGARFEASQLPGLVFPAGGYSVSGSSMQHYPRGGFSMDTGRGDYQLAIAFGILSIVMSPPLICCWPLVAGPLLFSSLGLYFSSLATRKGYPSSKTAMTLNLVGLVAAMVLGVGFQIFMYIKMGQIR